MDGTRSRHRPRFAGDPTVRKDATDIRPGAEDPKRSTPPSTAHDLDATTVGSIHQLGPAPPVPSRDSHQRLKASTAALPPLPLLHTSELRPLLRLSLPEILSYPPHSFHAPLRLSSPGCHRLHRASSGRYPLRGTRSSLTSAERAPQDSPRGGPDAPPPGDDRLRIHI